jgi:hypothetical protein
MDFKANPSLFIRDKVYGKEKQYARFKVQGHGTAKSVDS